MKPIALALLALFAAACGATRGPCAPASELPKIEARYHAELVAKCNAFQPADPAESCPYYTEITERARRAREEWAACKR